MKSLFTTAALAVLIGMAVAPPSAALPGDSDPASAEIGSLHMAQGATPEGWRKEQDPRYQAKKKNLPEVDSNGWPVTKFPPEQEPRFKKPINKN